MHSYLRKFKQTKIIKSKDYPELRISITRSPASFSITVYRGKYKVSQVYTSPYQRKFEGYYSPDENKRLEFAPYELIAMEIIQAQEEKLMEEYEAAFKSCKEKYPQPSIPIKAEL